jgi:F420-non-reducing hydrogenase large subunit
MQTLGLETSKRILAIRKKTRELSGAISGSPLYPACGLPGGMSKAITPEQREAMEVVADEALDFAQFTLQVFEKHFLAADRYLDRLRDEAYAHETYYMGMVDEKGLVSFYDGRIRIVGPDGEEFALFRPEEFSAFLEERVEHDSYGKTLYLKPLGWKGLTDGADSGVYRVAPLARLNASRGMPTPLAQAEYERFFDFMGAKPVHHTMAYHWARVIEIVYAAERMRELVRDQELTDKKVRNLPTAAPREGIGACEAPRGTLIHHYRSDENGIIEGVNLLVGTQNNHAAISMTVEKVAKASINGAGVSESARNAIETALRAYDPCFGCSTHALSDERSLAIVVYDHAGHRVD